MTWSVVKKGLSLGVKTYIKVKGKLLFDIFEPEDIPNMKEMSNIWNRLAHENNLPGFCFFGLAQGSGTLAAATREGIDKVVYDAMFDAVYVHNHQRNMRIKAKLRNLLQHPNPVSYDLYAEVATNMFLQYPDTIPCIDPNFDHSPRSGSRGTIIVGSTSPKWGVLLGKTISTICKRQRDDLLFIKAWNEWGEGCYLEPDLKFGLGYLMETKRYLYGQ